MSKYKPLEWCFDDGYHWGLINKDLSFRIYTEGKGFHHTYIYNYDNEIDIVNIGTYNTLKDAKQACENYQFRELAE